MQEEVTNPIEDYKKAKPGLTITEDIPSFIEKGWQSISPADRELLKWVGVFFRKRTPGFFMMRVRMPGGRVNSEQLRTVAELSRRVGNNRLDITTRQQMELRSYQIKDVPEIVEKLRGVNLNSLQTGMDNIRNVNNCAVAGLTPYELFDASPVVKAFHDRLIGNIEYMNLPRKLNVTMTGCLENCTHVESQDIGLLPAIFGEAGDGKSINGFNVLVGGKMGSGGFRVASALDVFITFDDVVPVCEAITFIYRDHGSRGARNHNRLAFLIEEWGEEKFRQEVETRLGKALRHAGKDARKTDKVDHLGVHPQKQPGLSYVGVAVPVGRVTADDVTEMGRLADDYGDGQVRLTTAQNVIFPNIPEATLENFLKEPLLQTYKPEARSPYRGMVACTGTDFCNLAVIESKGLALELAKKLEPLISADVHFTTHWSGCAASCGNHQAADIGFQGTKASVDNKSVDAVHIFVGGSTGPNAKPGEKIVDSLPVEMLPEIVPLLLKHLELLKRVKKERPGDKRIVMVPQQISEEEL